jgi:hypothetical protein
MQLLNFNDFYEVFLAFSFMLIRICMKAEGFLPCIVRAFYCEKCGINNLMLPALHIFYLLVPVKKF